MKQTQKLWLHDVPWDSVVTINKALCQAQKVEPAYKTRPLEIVRTRWDSAVPRTMTLKEVLELCRQCQELLPFTFNNGNTFAAIARTLVEDWLKTLPPLEAQIIRTTVAHYVAGLVGRRELAQVLRHFEATWREATFAEPVSPPSDILPQAQPRV